MSLEHLWAGWRREYIVEATQRERAGGLSQDAADCVFCRLAASGPPSEDNLVVWRGELTFVVMNAYPYASGHVLVMPLRHVGPLSELTEGESAELWSATQRAAATPQAHCVTNRLACRGIFAGFDGGSQLLGHRFGEHNGHALDISHLRSPPANMGLV